MGVSLYDGTAGIAIALAACASVAPPPDAERLAETARSALYNALAEADELLASGRLGLFDGATGIAWAAAITARTLGDAALRDRASALALAVVDRAGAGANGAGPDLIAGLAGTLLGLQ